MHNITAVLQQWNLDLDHVRRQMYRAPTPRERERWHALWLAAQGWSAAHIAETLDRNPHTIGGWLTNFHQYGPASLAFEQTGGSPPFSNRSNRNS